MFCPSCKERIPIISNITINIDNIMLIFFCQCKEENMTYNLNNYMKEIKKENKNVFYIKMKILNYFVLIVLKNYVINVINLNIFH